MMKKIYGIVYILLCSAVTAWSAQEESQFINYYKVLGLNNFASKAEIDNVYKRLLVRSNPFSLPQYIGIIQAFAVLSNDLQKAAFDKKLQEFLEEQKAQAEWEVVEPESDPGWVLVFPKPAG